MPLGGVSHSLYELKPHSTVEEFGWLLQVTILPARVLLRHPEVDPAPLSSTDSCSVEPL